MPPHDGSIDPTAARATLESLAIELQSLPIASLAPAFVLVLAGVVLLLVGRRVLRPVLVVTSILFGAAFGAPLLGGLLRRVGTLGLTLLGGILGLLAVAIAWRLMYGAALGIVVAFFVSVVVLIGVDAGVVDARRPASGPEAAPSAAAVEGAGMHSPDRPAFLDRTPAFVRPLAAWAASRWSSEPPQVRSLLTATAAAGGFVGLVVGSLLPQSAAALLTSIVGGLFTLLGGLPLLARAFDAHDRALPPIAWLGAWMALALAGWIVQLPSRKVESPDAAPASERAASTRKRRRESP